MANGGIIGPVQTSTTNSVSDKISTFNASGTFTAQATADADFLVVAGGGGAGASMSSTAMAAALVAERLVRRARRRAV